MMPTATSMTVQRAESTLSHPGSLDPNARPRERRRRKEHIHPLRLKLVSQLSERKFPTLTILQEQRCSPVPFSPAEKSEDTLQPVLEAG